MTATKVCVPGTVLAHCLWFLNFYNNPMRSVLLVAHFIDEKQGHREHTLFAQCPVAAQWQSQVSRAVGLQGPCSQPLSVVSLVHIT